MQKGVDVGVRPTLATLCVLAVAWSQPVRAQAPIQNNKYSVELFNGPYFGASRPGSVAGANTATAAGVDAVAVNPAAAAVRDPYSWRWFDYDLTAGISFPGAFFVRSDFYNREPRPGQPEQRTRGLGLINFGASLQFGNLAISANTDQYQHEIAVADAAKPDVTVAFGRSNLVLAYGFLNNQIVVGAGLRLITASFNKEGTFAEDPFGSRFGAANNALNRRNNVLDLSGVGPQLGVVIKPDDEPFRIGVSYRHRILARPTADRPNTRSPEDGIARVGGYVLPERVVAPWEIEIGGAWQLGERPLNPRWRNPRLEDAEFRRRIERAREIRARQNVSGREERAIRRIEEQQFIAEQERLYEERREEYNRLPRERLLLMASALITGSSEDAVSVIGFAEQVREVTGRSVTVTPRIGIEGEPIANRLITRAGTYMEPSRSNPGSFRQHFTAGAELRLFHVPKIWVLQPFDISTVGFVDFAPRYMNFGLSISLWH